MSKFLRTRFVKLIAVALCVLVMAYPLSYAPVVKWMVIEYRQESDVYPVLDGVEMPLYKPIDWLIDSTLLKHPLFAWARMWDVEEEFDVAEQARTSFPALRPQIRRGKILRYPPRPTSQDQSSADSLQVIID